MAITRIECADRPEWLRARRRLGVGASEAAGVLGLSRFASPAEIYMAKRTGLVRDSDLDAPGYLWWGLRLEPIIAERFAVETGYTVEDTGDYTIFVDDEKPWRFATLDRWVVTPEDGAPLELKNTRAVMRRYWHAGVPLEVQIQAQQQMAVMGSARAFVAVLHEGSDYAHYEIARHQEFIDILDSRTRAFWDDTKRGIVPIDGDKRTRDVINEMYEATGSPRVLPFELAEWDRKRQLAVETIKAAEAEKNEAEARIILALEDAAFGTIANTKITWKRTAIAESVVPSFTKKAHHRLTRSEGKR